jgi:1,4-dihydroxy-2-naphthoate octaprenyltransferase
VAQGLILLGFLAVLAAYFTVRTRRRLGLGSTGRHWVLVITGFVIVVLVLWAVSTR